MSRLWYFDVTQSHIVTSCWPIVLRRFLSGSREASHRGQVHYHSLIIDPYSRRFQWLAYEKSMLDDMTCCQCVCLCKLYTIHCSATLHDSYTNCSLYCMMHKRQQLQFISPCQGPVFPIAIQIRWRFRFTLTSILLRWLLQNLLHGTTACSRGMCKICYDLMASNGIAVRRCFLRNRKRSGPLAHLEKLSYFINVH